MTPTETIAVKLFGWEPYLPKPLEFDDDVRALYRKEGELVALFNLDPPCLRAVAIDGSTAVDWPDLADWNWIRRMEDALADKGLLSQYINRLSWHPYSEDQDSERRSLTSVEESHWFYLRATASQRVAAALQVIEEAGL